MKLVELGAVRPLVNLMAADAEPRHYAGLALLKLADNMENHMAIAAQGGIQALLRLGRTRSTDDQMQYKAALTVGQLASNAVKVLPQGGGVGAAKAASAIGHGAKMMTKVRSQAAVQKGREGAIGYLEKSTNFEKQPNEEPPVEMSRTAGGERPSQSVTQKALNIGVRPHSGGGKKKKDYSKTT